ncbi:MAG: hypothetical protein VX723_01730 [Candidatus Thermoplasmatota archaeon]|nr:hypothetical protein [Candidatus Thermoplasmatota archaeon]
MPLAEAQIWAGFCLVAIGFAMHRTGPAFRRHPVGVPVAVLGLALMLLHTEQPAEPETLLMQATMDAGPWLVLAALGTISVLTGAPTYSNSKPLPLLVGWGLMFAAWYLMFAQLPELTPAELLSWASSILGAVSAIAVFALSVRITERRTPAEPETTPLTEKERKYVESVLKRHLEAADES